MRRALYLLAKPRGRENENQASARTLRSLETIRAHHLRETKAREEKPYGKADRHVIEAWTEIEVEDRAELLAKGTPFADVDRIIFERRAEWIKQTTSAWEAYHETSATPLTDKANKDAAAMDAKAAAEDGNEGDGGRGDKDKSSSRAS